MTGFIERLKTAMDYRGVTASDIAKGTGINKSNISRYFSGEYNAKTENIYKIANFLHVSEPWLAFGIGKMTDFFEDEDNNETPQHISGYNGNKTQIISNKVSILGKVACGEPIFSPESADVYTTVDSNIRVDFALIATGDSMIEDHIYDGDIVLIRQQPTVELGEIAAVSINDEITLKRVYYYPKDNRMVLNPSNPQHKPMMFFNEELENIRILGKVIAVQHFF